MLVPCVLDSSPTRREPERYAAVDGGVLLLERDRVSVVTREAVVADRARGRAGRGGGDAGVAPPAGANGPRRVRRTADALCCGNCTQVGEAISERAETGRRTVRSRGAPAGRATVAGGAADDVLAGARPRSARSAGWSRLPAVGGAFLGRWIDGRYGTGIFWTLSLLLSGLAARLRRARGGTSIGRLQDELGRGGEYRASAWGSPTSAGCAGQFAVRGTDRGGPLLAGSRSAGWPGSWLAGAAFYALPEAAGRRSVWPGLIGVCWSPGGIRSAGGRVRAMAG